MSRRFCVFATLLSPPAATLAGHPYSHSWDTVSDIMSMHGKYKTDLPLDTDMGFVAEHYGGMITTCTGCTGSTAPGGGTIEEFVLSVAARIKATKPSALVGI